MRALAHETTQADSDSARSQQVAQLEAHQMWSTPARTVRAKSYCQSQARQMAASHSRRVGHMRAGGVCPDLARIAAHIDHHRWRVPRALHQQNLEMERRHALICIARLLPDDANET